MPKAKYTTYYIESNGQPSNDHADHETIEEALKDWLACCGCVQAASGGRAVLHDESDDEELEWIESCEGGYATGELFGEMLCAIYRDVEEDGNDMPEASDIHDACLRNTKTWRRPAGRPALVPATQLGRLITDRMQAIKWTQAETSKRSGVPQSTISDIVSGKIDPKLSTCARLRKTLIITHAEFFAAAEADSIEED